MQINVGGGVKATINITPLADVCLVLLIVFMMMTAMIRQGVSVKLPVAHHARTVSTESQDKLITVSVTDQKELFLNMKPMENVDQLERELVLAYRGREGQPVVIKGAQELEYGEVLSLMNVARQLGVAEVELVAKKEKQEGEG
jgi:biopolymer transport protein ExbD